MMVIKVFMMRIYCRDHNIFLIKQMVFVTLWFPWNKIVQRECLKKPLNLFVVFGFLFVFFTMSGWMKSLDGFLRSSGAQLWRIWPLETAGCLLEPRVLRIRVPLSRFVPFTISADRGLKVELVWSRCAVFDVTPMFSRKYSSCATRSQCNCHNSITKQHYL